MEFQDLGKTEAAHPAQDISSSWEVCSAEDRGDVLARLIEIIQPPPSDLPALLSF